MSETMRKAYRERLHTGETVYLLEGAGILGLKTEPLVVKEGIVTETTEYKFSDKLRTKPVITIIELTGEGGITSRSPREVFKPEEVAYHLRKSDYTRDLVRGKKPEELIKNDPGNKDVIGTLGGAIINRMIDDFVIDPKHPEDPNPFPC